MAPKRKNKKYIYFFIFPFRCYGFNAVTEILSCVSFCLFSAPSSCPDRSFPTTVVTIAPFLPFSPLNFKSACITWLVSTVHAAGINNQSF